MFTSSFYDLLKDWKLLITSGSCFFSMDLLILQTNGDSSDSLEGSLNTNERRSIPNFFPNAHSKEVACFAIPTPNFRSLLGRNYCFCLLDRMD